MGLDAIRGEEAAEIVRVRGKGFKAVDTASYVNLDGTTTRSEPVGEPRQPS